MSRESPSLAVAAWGTGEPAWLGSVQGIYEELRRVALQGLCARSGAEIAVTIDSVNQRL